MARKIKLLDVARDAGVSPATVSRAMAQPELLSASTLERVRRSALKLGYLPDGAARALASGRSMTVGAIVPTLDSAVFARMLQALQTNLARHRYQLLVASHEGSSAAETQALRTLLGRGVDGIVLVGAEHDDEATALLASSDRPVVLTFCRDPAFPSVTIDNELAGRLAARHLLDLGHRRIGMITGPLMFNDRQRLRLAGVRAELRTAGLPLPNSMTTEQALTRAGGRSGCAALLEASDPPTAFVGGIDLIALGCIAELQARGLNVPRDVSVVGIDGLEMSAHLSPSLSAVHLPIARIGQVAAESLTARLCNEPFEDHVELGVELIARRSTGPIAINHMDHRGTTR